MITALMLLVPALGEAATAFSVQRELKDQKDASPTMTLLYAAESPQVTVILIPGGEGKLKFTEATKGTRQPNALMLQKLADPAFSSLRANVVVFDSPQELFSFSLRKSSDHLDRIENVVRFYRNKLGVPVWLFGHSWGSVSVTEFINRSAESRALIAGVITSATRADVEIKEGMNLPILFLHHEKDGCQASPYFNAKRIFERTKSKNGGVTELLTVTGGESKGDPCRDGRHMYLGAYDEAANLVAQFVKQNSAPKPKN